MEKSQKQGNPAYHATAEGKCSCYKFAREICAANDTKVDLQVAEPNEFSRIVSRPKYSALENGGLTDLGLNRFSPCQDGLREYFGRTYRVAAQLSE